MVFHLNSMGLAGISGYLVEVECCIASGLPGFDIVGLPDAAVKESREPGAGGHYQHRVQISNHKNYHQFGPRRDEEIRHDL